MGNIYGIPRIPVIFSEYGYIKFFDTIIETAYGVTKFEIFAEDGDSNIVDEIRYDDKSDRYEFCLEGDVVAVIKAEKFESLLDRK